MTKERKEQLKEINQKKFGLSKEYIQYLKLPKSSNVKVYDIGKILNARRKLSSAEKIQHLQDIKNALEKKLKVLKSGKKIIEFEYYTPQEFESKYNKCENPEETSKGKEEELKRSTIDEQE